jgi:1-acyl-sn-glycerol-3-phosphate acyltransferase
MIRGFFCVIITITWTTILFPLCLVSMLVRWNWSAAMWVVVRLWSPVLLWAGGARLHVEGMANVDLSKPAVYVSNHQSTIDIPILFFTLRENLRFVAKHTLRYVPVLGWYMSLSRFVFIDRSNRTRAIASLDEAADRIRGGISIVMFPEGTRSGTRHILPFKKGPFALAEKANVPVVPVSIEGSGQLMPKNSWVITPGAISVRFGKPLNAAQFSGDRGQLMSAVRNAIIELNLDQGGLGGAPAGLESEE